MSSAVDEITGAGAQKRAARAAERGAVRAAAVQREGLAQQQAQFQQQQQQIRPFIDQSLAARQQLAQLAQAPLGEGAAFQEAERTGLQNLKRALASQGSFFSGRFGEGAAQLGLGLLQGQQQQRLQALGQLGGTQPLGISAGVAGQSAGALGQSFANLSGLEIARGQAQAAGQTPGLLGQVAGLGLGLASSGLFGSFGGSQAAQGQSSGGVFS